MKPPIWRTDKCTLALNQCKLKTEAKRSAPIRLIACSYHVKKNENAHASNPFALLFLLLFLKGAKAKCELYGNGCCYQTIIPLITCIPPPNIDYWPPKHIPLPPKPEYYKSLVLDSNCNMTLDPDLSKSFPGLQYISNKIDVNRKLRFQIHMVESFTDTRRHFEAIEVSSLGQYPKKQQTELYTKGINTKKPKVR